MEEIYRASLFKSFMRTLDDGFFPVIIVDAIHDKVTANLFCLLRIQMHASRISWDVLEFYLLSGINS